MIMKREEVIAMILEYEENSKTREQLTNLTVIDLAILLYKLSGRKIIIE